MDSEAFPVANVYVEDDISEMIVKKAIAELAVANLGFLKLLKVVVVGSADKTYRYFESRKALHHLEDKTPRPACVLDGDMERKSDGDGNVMYPYQDGLFFHYTNAAPEKMLWGYFSQLIRMLTYNITMIIQIHTACCRKWLMKDWRLIKPELLNYVLLHIGIMSLVVHISSR